MEVILQSLSPVFSDNYFSICWALVLNHKIKVFEERSQQKYYMWTKPPPGHPVRWTIDQLPGHSAALFLPRACCGSLQMSTLSFHHFPRKKLILQKGQSTQYFAMTLHRWLDSHFNVNHFCHLHCLPLASLLMLISPILRGPTQAPPLLWSPYPHHIRVFRNVTEL